MNPRKVTVSPLLAQARAMLERLREAGLTWRQIMNATGLSQAGLQNIANEKNKSVTSATIDALSLAVSRLDAGHIGPLRSSTQEEGDMVERWNRDAAEVGLPLWDDLRERDREEIRARWQEAMAAQKRLALQMENDVLRWAETFVREKVQAR
jgi:transcriptional regulator with XRE-family HTH domain